jgi:cytoskeletal protein RodZ
MATGIGETLVAARRQQGVALSDAAAETRVRESYLAALEAEDFAALGGDVYVKGFLRSYARFLRLDPEPLIAAYRAEYERHHADDIAPLAHQPVAPLQTERSPVLLIGAGVAVIVVAVLALIGWLGGNNEDPEDPGLVAPVPVETTPTPVASDAPSAAPTEATTSVPNDAPTEVLAADSVRLRLVLDGPSWMRVTVDGQVQLEGEQPAGETLRFRADESVTVRIGDASQVQVRVNGENRGVLGGSQEVVEKTYTVEDAA